MKDDVKYTAMLKKDGTFKISFDVEVPAAFWINEVRKRVHRDPTDEVKITDKAIMFLENSKEVHKILKKIEEDISHKMLKPVSLAMSKITEAKIVKNGKKYYAKVVVIGVWGTGQ